MHHDLRQQPADQYLLVRSDERGVRWQQHLVQLPDLGPHHDRLHRRDLRVLGVPALHRLDRYGRRRLQARDSAHRLVHRSQPFPVAGIVGKDFIKASNNNSLGGGVGTNGQLTLANGSAVTGSVQLWQGAPNPIGYSGSVTRNPNPFVLSPPNMLNPTTLLDSKTSNDNGRLLAGANPSDSCSNGSGSCYTAATRTLNLNNNDSVTLGGGVYNFCQINFGNSTSVNIAVGARILIFIDSPGRSGSGCPAGTGGMATGNGATFSNPSQDPTLKIVDLRQAPAWPTIDLRTTARLRGGLRSEHRDPVQEQRPAHRRAHRAEHRVQEQRLPLGRPGLVDPVRDDLRVLPRLLAAVQQPRLQHHGPRDRLPVGRRRAAGRHRKHRSARHSRR